MLSIRPTDIEFFSISVSKHNALPPLQPVPNNAFSTKDDSGVAV
jgi:hypothetical protein